MARSWRDTDDPGDSSGLRGSRHAEKCNANDSVVVRTGVAVRWHSVAYGRAGHTELADSLLAARHDRRFVRFAYRQIV